MIQLSVSKLLCTSIPFTRFGKKKQIEKKLILRSYLKRRTKIVYLNLQAILSLNIDCHIFIILTMTLFLFV